MTRGQGGTAWSPRMGPLGIPSRPSHPWGLPRPSSIQRGRHGGTLTRGPCEAGCCGGWRAPLSATAGPALWLRAPRASPSSGRQRGLTPSSPPGPPLPEAGVPRSCCVGRGRGSQGPLPETSRFSGRWGLVPGRRPPSSLPPARLPPVEGKASVTRHSDLHGVRGAAR